MELVLEICADGVSSLREKIFNTDKISSSNIHRCISNAMIPIKIIDLSGKIIIIGLKCNIISLDKGLYIRER